MMRQLWIVFSLCLALTLFFGHSPTWTKDRLVIGSALPYPYYTQEKTGFFDLLLAEISRRTDFILEPMNFPGRRSLE